MADSTSGTAAGTCRTARPSSLAASTLSGKVSAGYTDGQRRTAALNKDWHSSSRTSALEGIMYCETCHGPMTLQCPHISTRPAKQETHDRKQANKMLQLL